jgi:hypothetical protein
MAPDGLEQTFDEILHLGPGRPRHGLPLVLGTAGAGVIELPG